jgi:hypothetical protein
MQHYFASFMTMKQVIFPTIDLQHKQVLSNLLGEEWCQPCPS